MILEVEVIIIIPWSDGAWRYVRKATICIKLARIHCVHLTYFICLVPFTANHSPYPHYPRWYYFAFLHRGFFGSSSKSLLFFLFIYLCSLLQEYTPLLVIYLCIVGEVILHNYPAFVQIVESVAQQLNKQVTYKHAVDSCTKKAFNFDVFNKAFTSFSWTSAKKAWKLIWNITSSLRLLIVRPSTWENKSSIKPIFLNTQALR